MPENARAFNASGKMSWRRRTCAVCVLFAATAMALSAQKLTTLVVFDGADGEEPNGPVVQGTDGDGYGTTLRGGANNSGTVFKFTRSGTLTTLYSFCSPAGCADGEYPHAGLVQATDGDFYGTTGSGGAKDYGTVFKITGSGTLNTLYSFCSQAGCRDGGDPLAGLVQATDGDFYGTTYEGGASDYGTVFKITASGTLTTLYGFCSQAGCTDGEYPSFGGLVQATNGDFYGTTSGGGANGDYGTVFKLTPRGTLTTLYSFCSQAGCADGEYPSAGLVQASNGDFYGTTDKGGANGYGTVFRITGTGTLATLHSFCSQAGCTDGEYPSGLVQATNGDFYGATGSGGASGYGTAFQITGSGRLTTLHSFDVTDGAAPSGLAQATNGDFYGTTGYGASGYGTVFRLSVGLGPFVKAQPTSGKVGAAVQILGTDLTGATSVTFNGTPAAFTVASPTLITTTVPTGATTGKVRVVTPSGTLSSNVPFRVP